MHRSSFLLWLLLLSSPALAQRLPATAVPEHYTLWFAPDFTTDTFRGRETIRVRLTQPTRTVTLHAAEIEFGQVRITAAGRTQDAAVALDEPNETATLTVPSEMPAGTATIEATFTGVLNEQLRGFYLSRANGRKYAVSQMEATDARRAFPSFDEPAFKATFDIALMIDQGDTAISNGAQISDQPGPEPGKHTVTFATTRRMSTYLVALLVGDFACREATSDGVPVRVCSTPDKKELTQFALDAAVQQLAFYNDYYGIPYPFGKLDIIGIPDFAAGAMENTGAITFREQYLLADPGRASLGTQKTIASILSHEIAHQWFGNLVTMQWWDDLWLNEGFATWMANKPLAAWRPDWHVELDDVEATQAALSLDVLRGTRPIRIDVETPEEINEVFDAIAYEKSAGVLRMIERYVGVDVFRNGVASYLQKQAYGNATAEDFWGEISRVSGKPVDRIMASFVDQPGAPVIGVASRCLGSSTEVRLQQERFVGVPGGAKVDSQTWTIPVCLKAFPDSPATCEVISAPVQTVSVPGCAAEPFINDGSLGYYVSQYEPPVVRTLSRKARGTLAPAERLGLLGDEWWMMRGGRHDISLFLDLAAALADDTTADVTAALATRISYVGEYLVDDAERQAFQRWVQRRFGPALERLGLPGPGEDAEDQQSRRAALLELLGIWGASSEIQEEARRLALRYATDPASLPGTLVSAVLRVAAYGGDAGLYDRYAAHLGRLSSQPEEYYRFFNALSYFRDPALTKRTLALAISPSVRTQDAGLLIAGVLARPWSRTLAWTFVKAEWEKLAESLGAFQGVPIVVSAAGTFCSAADAVDVRSFFAEHPVPSSARTLQLALERIDNCAAVDERQSADLARWLQAAR